MKNEVNITENQEKLVNLMKNREFVDKVISQESISDVQKLFKSKGIELSETDVESLGDIIDEVANKVSSLKEGEIENISGGVKPKDIGGAIGGLAGGAVGVTSGIAIGGVLGHFMSTKRPRDSKKFERIGRIVGGVIGGTIGVSSGAKVGYTAGKSICGWRNNDKNRVDV